MTKQVWCFCLAEVFGVDPPNCSTRFYEIKKGGKILVCAIWITSVTLVDLNMSRNVINREQANSVGLKKEDIREIVSILSKYGVDKIYLFGSYATGEAQRDSDIDLAVDGMKGEVFFKAYGEVLLRISRNVDLIDLSDAKRTLQNRIEREGQVIYEK